jgi:hypothetical protein
MLVNERMALIDDEIKDQFVGITQLMLESGSGLSQIICELCLRSLQLASAVKLQFIENQRKLHYFADDSDENDSNRSESPTIQPPEPITKRRKREPRHDDYIDPLSLVTVHSNETFEIPETIRPSTIKIKQEQPFESYNYEELPTMLSEQEDRKPKFNRSFNIPKTERKLNAVGEKSFQCPHCKNFYKRRPHMLRHIEVAHMKCKFICVVPNCEQFFVRKERLKKHLEVSHADLAPQDMTAMIDKLRILKPVYGNEVPEVFDDSQNAAGDDSINQDVETKEEQNNPGTSNDFGTTSNGINDLYDERDSLFRGLELERRRIMELENVRGFMSDLREAGKSSMNQTM